MNKPIYLDYNATTPVAPEVIDAIRPFLAEHFGNPSSSHLYGLSARQAVAEARTSVAALIHAQEDEIVFTGSATEANNLALFHPSGCIPAKWTLLQVITTQVLQTLLKRYRLYFFYQ